MHVEVDEVLQKKSPKPKSFFQKYKIYILMVGVIICMGLGLYFMFEQHQHHLNIPKL